MKKLLCGAAAALLCLALPCAEAATINFTGAGTTANSSGTVDFAIRNNESSGEKTLALTGGALTFYFDWDTDWLWVGFDLPWGGYTETFTAHRTVPYRTAPSSTSGSITRTLASGAFAATFTTFDNDFLYTGTIPWRIGAGAPAVVTVPDSQLSLGFVSALLALLVAAHRRFICRAEVPRC